MPKARRSFLPLIETYYQHMLELAKAQDNPLLADGIDSFSNAPVKWDYPDGNSVPMSNFASQQNFIRGLVALSEITGKSEYKEKAFEITLHFFSHYVDEQSGLFNWGGHRFINHNSGAIEGPASKECVHELKHHFPYYEFLHEVDPQITQNYLKGFWAAHVLDWEKLDLSRHGEYGQAYPEDIFSLHEPQPVVDSMKWPELPETIGLTFVNASTDLIYAACHYYKYTGDRDALKWAKHLYYQFVSARHPETGMPVYQFSSPKQRQPIPEDDRITFSWFGDRAKRQFGPEFGEIAREANALFRDCWPVVVDNPLAILECAKTLKDEEMTRWVISGIKAYFNYAWDEKNNEILPMWNDGTDLTGYTFKRDGYYGEKGTILSRQPADPAYLLTLIRASILSQDKDLRELTSRMFKRFGLGTLNPESLELEELTPDTQLASSYLIFALLDLYQFNQDDRLLNLAHNIGNNLVKNHYHRGCFVESADHKFVRLDDPTPYALLSIEAAFMGIYSDIPVAISKGGYLHGEQKVNDEVKAVYDYEVIYSQTI